MREKGFTFSPSLLSPSNVGRRIDLPANPSLPPQKQSFFSPLRHLNSLSFQFYFSPFMSLLFGRGTQPVLSQDVRDTGSHKLGKFYWALPDPWRDLRQLQAPHLPRCRWSRGPLFPCLNRYTRRFLSGLSSPRRRECGLTR